MDIGPRIALQLVNESALCINRVRKKSSLGNQGFQLLNGMGRLATDEQVHLLLNSHKIKDPYKMMTNLGLQRQLSGHYQGDIIAIDPHRIISSSKRAMPRKKKKPDAPSQKMLQTFFAVSAGTGQPIMATMSSAGMPTTKATLQLLQACGQIINSPSLLVADKEHFSKELFNEVHRHENFDFLAPAMNTGKIKKTIRALQYSPVGAGFALSETGFNFNGDKAKLRLLAERFGEQDKDYRYNAFLTTSGMKPHTLLAQKYDERWSVEEFFRFENDMGLNRASTMDLNIRYGKLAMAMIAQGATYELRKNLKEDYKKWDAKHLANEILAWNDGDIKVKDDTIIITFYGKSDFLNTQEYTNFPQKLIQNNISPYIPWLYNFKVDFRFK